MQRDGLSAQVGGGGDEEEFGGEDFCADGRLAHAVAEEQIAREQFDAVIVNDDVGRAVGELAAIVEARRNGSR